MRVGDYVRTIKGNIYKLKEEDLMFEMTRQNCKISSPNIIDLIEVGDYVNGYQVLNIYNYKNCDSHLLVNGIDFNVIMQGDIESIVTKEQFENIKYKIGD